MAVVPSSPVQCPRGGRLALAWLVATVAAAIPHALDPGFVHRPAPGFSLATLVTFIGLACTPLVSATALALCRRAEKTAPLTRDRVVGIFGLTGLAFAAFTALVASFITVALLLSVSAGSSTAAYPKDFVATVPNFLAAGIVAILVSLTVGVPLSVFAGYVVSRFVFRAPDDPPKEEVADASPEASRP